MCREPDERHTFAVTIGADLATQRF